jgi:carboxypeptidase family protein/TonB-dependent receptor-like protein
MSSGRLALALALVMGAAGTGAAQPRTGTISGTVTSDEGKRLSAVVVTVENDVAGVRRTSTTDADGHYAIPDLPVEGDYVVRVALAGFATVANERVTVLPSGRTVVDFVLKLTMRETVAVTAESPIAESHQSTVQQTVSDNLVHTLPLVGRNFIPLASLAAGFTGNPNYPSPQGQIYWSNNVLVDGASHFSKWRSAPRTFYSGYSLESIKEIHVLTNRFSAEYGEALATVTSAVTKAGDDQFRGSVLLFVQDASLNAPPEFSPINPPSSTERYGVTLGGPIEKTRTHFLESYEGRRARNSNVVVSPAAAGQIVPDNEDEHLAFFRVDHRVSAAHFVMSRYNGQFFRWHDEPGGLSLPGSGTSYTNDVHTWLTTDRREMANVFLNEARFQFARYKDVRTDLQPGVFVSRSGYSQEGGVIGPLGFGADPEDTWEGADTLSYLSDAHSVKVGGGIKFVRSHNPSVNYARGAYFFAGPPDQFTKPYLFIQGIAPTVESAIADPRSVSAVGFVQDDWRVRRQLTLNLGLRYDVDKIYNVRNYSPETDTNNFQPRAGIAWRPGDSDQFVIRGGAGLYTQQHLLFYINRVQQEGPDGTITVSLAPDSPLFPAFPAALSPLAAGALYPPRNIEIVDQLFRNPYSIQSTVGFERMFARVRISADYVYLNGRDLMSLVDQNPPASNVKPAQRSVAAADATRDEVAPGGFRQVIALGNVGRSWYHALQVKADRSVGRLQAMASYTLSHAEDMANYQLPEDSLNIQAEKARANTDVRHNLTVGFTLAMPGSSTLLKSWSVSGIGVFRSNRPYTISWGDDRNGTTQNDARPDGRNTAETDGYQNVDLALSRRFTFRSSTIEGRIEGFNIFNVTNYDEYVGMLLSPLYGRPVSAFPKRRMQLAAVVRF